MALLESAANGVTLNTAQAHLVRGWPPPAPASSWRIAPAGSGKTTAMAALTARWTERRRHRLGLAPSAAAAAVLREQIGASTDTLAKLTWSHRPPTTCPQWARADRTRTLVVVDEAGMADTGDLAA